MGQGIGGTLCGAQLKHLTIQADELEARGLAMGDSVYNEPHVGYRRAQRMLDAEPCRAGPCGGALGVSAITKPAGTVVGYRPRRFIGRAWGGGPFVSHRALTGSHERPVTASLPLTPARRPAALMRIDGAKTIP